MTIVFFWTGATSYMAACWRELAKKAGVRLKVFVEVRRDGTTGYSHHEVLQGLDYSLTYEGEPWDRDAFRREVAALSPDVLVVLGWRCGRCRFVAVDPAFANVPKLFTFDMPFAFTPRKIMARFVLWPYLKRFSGAVVPSEASFRYARYLGFASSRVSRGLIGLDTEQFGRASETRSRLEAYPRRFLYVGRYTREKRMDVLLKAYRHYRKQVKEPWTLTCCGMGPYAEKLQHGEGVEDKGFVQPSELPRLYATHGAFVIASEYDPWPLVIAEAVASGLPVVCTEACGSHADFVRPRLNGLVCPTNQADLIADAMCWVHENERDLAAMGEHGKSLVAPFSKEQWANEWVTRCQGICHASRDRK